MGKKRKNQHETTKKKASQSQSATKFNNNNSNSNSNNDLDDDDDNDDVLFEQMKIAQHKPTTATKSISNSNSISSSRSSNSNSNSSSRSGSNGSNGSNGSSKSDSETSDSNNKQKSTSTSSSSSSSSSSNSNSTFVQWVLGNKYYIMLCLIIGFFVGLGLGIIFFVNGDDYEQLRLTGTATLNLNWMSSNRNSNGNRHKGNSNKNHKNVGSNGSSSSSSSSSGGEYDFDAPYRYITVNGRSVRDDPSHPLTFAILRESIIREPGGYVHPDLGLLVPAPCGASRGLGMVRDTYNTCQVRCMPGINAEKAQLQVYLEKKKGKNQNKNHGDNDDKNDKNDNDNDNEYYSFPPFWNAPADQLDTVEKLRHALDEQEGADVKYRQEEVLLRIPLRAQMTRNIALATLLPIIPHDVLVRSPLHELDDAALLVLLLAHERGRGIESTYHPYISSLPLIPSCGFSSDVRSDALETISIMGVHLGMDVNGWPGELSKASDRAYVIAEGLARDYGPYIHTVKGMTPFESIQWALCNVASRATAAADKYGALRLVPMLDMINHDVVAGGFEELGGAERLSRGNYVDATEEDSGTFIVRSLRHGRRKPLRKGQELLVNYNVPNYSPLDWFVSLGFVPPERSGKWTKVEDALPKSRTYGK